MLKTSHIKQAAEELTEQLIEWRRDFHRHPELGFEETRTAGIVADHLRSLGLEVSTGIGKTGVVAIIEGDKIDDDSPTILLRFDMDALPIQEETGLPFASTVDGLMHACGHDGHTAIGMGVAQVLAQHRNALRGRVKMVFQPAEEGLGGAAAMIGDGVMENPQPVAAFGLHLWSRLPLNQVVVQSGPLWANATLFELKVQGKGGHGAMPHETIDATLVAAQIVVAWQSIVARNVDPAQTAVITVGSLQSGGAGNVVSGEALLHGTTRCFDPVVGRQLYQRMEEIADGICQAFGASYTLKETINIPATVNSTAGAKLMHEAAREIVDDDQVTQITPMMVGEDMSEFLNRAPGCFVLIGAAPPDQEDPSPHHNPTFDFDEKVLPTGVALLSISAINGLEQIEAVVADR